VDISYVQWLSSSVVSLALNVPHDVKLPVKYSSEVHVPVAMQLIDIADISGLIYEKSF
jgi:hypothetical protein